MLETGILYVAEFINLELVMLNISFFVGKIAISKYHYFPIPSLRHGVSWLPKHNISGAAPLSTIYSVSTFIEIGMVLVLSVVPAFFFRPARNATPTKENSTGRNCT